MLDPSGGTLWFTTIMPPHSIRILPNDYEHNPNGLHGGGEAEGEVGEDGEPLVGVVALEGHIYIP
jgi:hypothetical protein